MMAGKKADSHKVTLSGMAPLVAKCENCGIRFERAYNDWGYKIGTYLFCTYRCMRTFERGGKKRRK